MFDGGANDVIGYALGFLNNDLRKEIGSANNTSADTVISDLEEVIIELKNKFPNSKICYIQPFLLDDATILNLTSDENQILEIKTRRNEFYTQLPILCNKLNIDYLDISNLFIEAGTMYRQDDYIHLREEGYRLITPYILEKLKEI